jgi:hypothetical protein
MKFSDFLRSGYFPKHSFTLNSIGLVDVFQRNNIKVVLIDIDGVKEKKLDLPHTIACQVLGLNCQDNRVKGIAESSIETNHRLHAANLMDVDQDILNKIDAIMRKYDCQFQEAIVGNSDIQILYANKIFQGCSELDTPREPMKLSDVVAEIKGLVS